EDGTEWLYARVRPRLPLARDDTLSLILAEERTNLSLGSEIGNLAGSIWQPFLRSALIAGLVAFAIALILGRTLTSPLKRLASAAGEVAEGKYPEVPVKGPDEIQQVATAFNRMTSEVQATQQSQRDFLANVSHDLKTPLTSIQGFSQAIMDGAARDPQQAANIIHDEATRLNRMVTELTDLARLQAGRLSMKMEALDIGALVSGIGERLRVVAEKKDITLHVQSANVPSIAGDGDRMVQVMMNIIGNAIKYTPNGGNVWVSTGIERGGIVITVRDDGMGIPEEDLPRIFDRFYQVDKARGPKRGTGLGLAITREILLGHGGDISIDSAGANQGTTVTIWLPSPQLKTLVTRRVSVD
ncbi:MAG: HAMP domain-containing sensor histidine kinase, partial [Chloroflexota bacterium]